jgi:hypothetical protein
MNCKWCVTLMLDTAEDVSICYMQSNILAANEHDAIKQAVLSAQKVKMYSIVSLEVSNVERQKESMN